MRFINSRIWHGYRLLLLEYLYENSYELKILEIFQLNNPVSYISEDAMLLKLVDAADFYATGLIYVTSSHAYPFYANTLAVLVKRDEILRRQTRMHHPSFQTFRNVKLLDRCAHVEGWNNSS